MRKKFCIAGAIAFACCGQAANAGTSDGTMLVGATILEACTIIAGPMAFGDVSLSGSDVDSTATLTLACTPNADYDILMNDGAHADAGQRRMTSVLTGEFVPYDIYLDSSRSERWGNTVGTDTLAGSANLLGVATHTAYGRIASDADSVEAGIYSDSVLVTVSF